MSPARSMSATAASTAIFRARLRCAKRWQSAGSTASTRRLQKIAEASGPAPARLERWLRTMFAIKYKKVSDDPEMFATYLALAQEACKVVKAHKDRLVDQIAHILSDGVKQGAFQVADVKATARAVFDATSPLPSSRPCRGMERSGSSPRGSTPCWRCCSGAWKRRASARYSARASQPLLGRSGPAQFRLDEFNPRLQHVARLRRHVV